jgi:hypothetical protein
MENLRFVSLAAFGLVSFLTRSSLAQPYSAIPASSWPTNANAVFHHNSYLPAQPSTVVRSSFELQVAAEAAVEPGPLVIEATPQLADPTEPKPAAESFNEKSPPSDQEAAAASDKKPEEASDKKEDSKKDEPKADDKKEEKKEEKKEKKWFEKYTIRGYAQFRYNEILSREEFSAPPQYVGDRSVAEDQTFLIRRARLIISGDVSDHLGIYLQPDFASTPNGSVDAIEFTQIRDWYGDCFIDKTKVHRIRVGQSKIPYGWENMQSSSNRLPLDRNDALNSAARNERDLGIFYYWTPEPAQEFFTGVIDKGLKGSGNYGVFGIGAYAGQGGSLAEQNDDLHFISRFTLPVEFCDGQLAEYGIQAYTGQYSVIGSNIRALGAGPSIIPDGTVERGNRRGFLDERVAWSYVWYPQPLGFQSEWTVGRGPALNAAQTALEERALYGGYAMTMYKYDTCCHGTLIPFARWNYFKGGYKSERNAPFSMINEWEMGLEWQFNKQMELVSMYTLTDRTNTTAINQAGVTSYRQFDGDFLRFQFQINY